MLRLSLISSNIGDIILGQMPPVVQAKSIHSKRTKQVTTPFKRSDSDLVAREWGPHRYTSVTNPLPDNESAQKFPISSQITGRLMELKDHKISIFEFLNPEGARVASASDNLRLLERKYDGSLVPIPESRLFPSLTHLYFLALDDRVYEVHFGNRKVSTISFPRSPTIVVH